MLLLGLFAGVVIAVGVWALCAAAGRADDAIESYNARRW
jgi:hypothetical protein